MRLSSALLASLLLASLVVVSTMDGDIHAGYFLGRSGDLILRSRQPVPTSSSTPDALLTQLTAGPSFFTGDSLDDTRVGDLLAHVLGTQPLNPSAYRGDFGALNLFARPKLAALLTLDGVDTDANSAAAALPLLLLGRSAVAVRSTAYPQTGAAARLTTMFSGTSPHTHGIVADAWIERFPGALPQAARAYDGSPSGAAVNAVNLPQAISASFGGRSLLLIGSASAPLAAAMLPTNGAVQPNTLGAWWETLAAHVATHSYALGPLASAAASLTFDSDVARRRLNADADATLFDDWHPSDLSVFAELELAVRITALLSHDANIAALLADDIPDFVSFAYSSPRLMRERYGADSRQYRRVLALVMDSMSALSSALATASENRAAVAALLLRADDATALRKADQLPSELRTLIGTLSSQRQWEQFLPSVYLSISSSDSAQAVLQHACARVTALAEQHNIDVVCPGTDPVVAAAQEHLFAVRALPELSENCTTINGTNSGNCSSNHTRGDDTLTDEEIGEYQVALWFTIILVSMAVASVFVIFNLDYESDQLLFPPQNTQNPF